MIELFLYLLEDRIESVSNNRLLVPHKQWLSLAFYRYRYQYQ